MQNKGPKRPGRRNGRPNQEAAPKPSPAKKSGAKKALKSGPKNLPRKTVPKKKTAGKATGGPAPFEAETGRLFPERGRAFRRLRRKRIAGMAFIFYEKLFDKTMRSLPAKKTGRNPCGAENSAISSIWRPAGPDPIPRASAAAAIRLFCNFRFRLTESDRIP